MTDAQPPERPRVSIIGLKGLPAAGGSARAGENMMALLSDRYDFRVYNSASHTERTTGVHDGVHQVVFSSFPIRKLDTLVYYLRALAHCLFTGGTDLVHVFHLDAAFMIPLLRLRYPVIAGHRARPQEFSKWGPVARTYFNVMEWIFYRFPADALTSVSSRIVDEYQGRTRRRIEYIPNGIVFDPDGPLAAPQTPPESARGGEDGEPGFALFAAGRLMETKGAHLFLEALGAIGFTGRVVVIGNPAHDPGYAQRLRELAEGLDVEFAGLIGDRNELFTLLREARVVVCPSSREGMSNMVLEAGVTARALICSDIPENRAVFERSEAVFFRSGDACDLAEKLRWVLDHPMLAFERAKRARRRVERDFNWETLAARYDQLYLDVLSGQRRSADGSLEE